MYDTKNRENDIDLIHQEHAEFIQIFDALHASIFSKEKQTAKYHILSFIEDVVMNHMKREENIMQKIDFPEYNHHLAEHKALRNHLHSLRLSWDETENESQLEILSNLRGCFIAHTRCTDLKFIEYYSQI